MRRLILLIGCCLLLTSCTDNIYEEQAHLYNSFIDETEGYSENDITTDIPFDIEVFFEKMIDEEITYRVIIDNASEEITNIKAIAIHNHETKDIYPTSGIFEQSLNLVPGVVNLKNNNAEGIILIGYIDYDGDIDSFKGVVKVLIEYNDSDGKLKKVYYEYHK